MMNQAILNKIQQAIAIADTILSNKQSPEAPQLMALLIQIRAEIRKAN